MINAYPVNEHSLRKDGCFVRRAGPAAADCDAEDEVKLLVERSGIRISAAAPFGLGKVLNIIYIPSDFVGLPFDGVNVEIVRETKAVCVVGTAGCSVLTLSVSKMHSAVDEVTRVNCFQNVNFSAAGPSAIN